MLYHARTLYDVVVRDNVPLIVKDLHNSMTFNLPSKVPKSWAAAQPLPVPVGTA